MPAHDRRSPSPECRTAIREPSLALGISRWRTIVHIVMKTASKGIITGVLLALARIAGETAPLLFTAFGNAFWNHNMAEPIAALPLCRSSPTRSRRMRTGTCMKRGPARSCSSPAFSASTCWFASSPATASPRHLNSCLLHDARTDAIHTKPGDNLRARCCAGRAGRQASVRRSQPFDLVRRKTGDQERHDRNSVAQRHRDHRPERLRQIDVPCVASIVCMSSSRGRSWKSEILFHGKIFTNPDQLIPRWCGVVSEWFSKSNPFPTMSIEENVLVGLRRDQRARPPRPQRAGSPILTAWPRSGTR